MKNFEIVFNGFDGSTDETDHLIKWVRAKNRNVVVQKYKNQFESITEIENFPHIPEDAIDEIIEDNNHA